MGEWDESKHPRVPAGNPGGGEFAGGAITGERATIRSMFQRMRQPDGGFTYQARTHFEPKTGYAVSPYPQRSFAKPFHQITIDDIAAYAVHNIDLLKKNDHYLGGWHDPKSHKAFLDVSIVTKSAAEAHRLCLRHDQKAYFDLRAGKSIEVNPHAHSGGAAD